MNTASLPLLALALIAARAPAARSGCDGEAVIHFDAVTAESTLVQGHRRTPLRGGDVVPTHAPVCVEVTGISTAVQSVAVTTEDTETLGLAATVEFLKSPPSPSDALKLLVDEVESFVSELVGNGKTRGGGELDAARRELRNALEQVRSLTYGPGGIHEARAAALIAAARMAAPTASCQSVTSDFRARFGPETTCAPGSSGDDCRRNFVPAIRLLDAYARLEHALVALRAMVKAAGDGADAQVASAATLIEKLPDVLADARGAQDLVKMVLDARCTVTKGPYSARWDRAVTIRVAVTPRQDAWPTGVASTREVAESWRVEETSELRVNGSAMFLYVPSAVTRKYGNQDGVVSQVESTRYRIQPALSFSFGHRRLDWRGRGGPALWFPDLVVAPFTEGGPSFGFGAALSFGPAKVGVGALWIRRTRLDGVALGQRIAADATVPTVRDYDPVPHLYLGAGVTVP